MTTSPRLLLVALACCSSLLASLSLLAPAGATTVGPEPSSSVSFDQTVRRLASSASTVYVAGDFTRARTGHATVVRRHIAAVSAATGRLLPWPVSVNGPVAAVAVSRGKVYLGGRFTRVNGRPVHGLARVSATTGKLDLGFRPRVVGSVHAVAFSKHRVYLGGEFRAVDGKQRSRLAAVSRSGRLQAWAPEADRSVRVLRVADGLVYAGGMFSSIDGDRSHGHLAALTARAGAVSAGFHPHLAVPALDLRVTKRTVVVAAGGPGGRLMLLNRTGSHRWTRTFDGDVAAVEVFGGRIYAGGHWDYLCATKRVATRNGDCLDRGRLRRPRLAAFAMNGTRAAWNPRPDSVEGVLSLTGAGGRLSVGGAFDTFDGGRVHQPKFAQFRPAP